LTLVFKILPKIEAQEGIFQTLTATIEGTFEKITAKTAEIASAVIENLTTVFIQDR
jgi:hypothetical protein